MRQPELVHLPGRRLPIVQVVVDAEHPWQLCFQRLESATPFAELVKDTLVPEHGAGASASRARTLRMASSTTPRQWSRNHR